jgi:hypothetical protein
MFIYLLSTFKLTAHKKGDIKNDHDPVRPSQRQRGKRQWQ